MEGLGIRRRVLSSAGGGGGGVLPAGYTRYDWISKNSWNDSTYLSLGIVPSDKMKFEIAWYDHGWNGRELALDGAGWGWSFGYVNGGEKVYWSQNDWTAGGPVVKNAVNTAICAYHYFKLNGVEYGWSDRSGGYPQDKWLGRHGFEVYYLKIWVNNILERDLVPCSNPLGVAGMYDMIHNVFYEDVGSGRGYNLGYDE